VTQVPFKHVPHGPGHWVLEVHRLPHDHTWQLPSTQSEHGIAHWELAVHFIVQPAAHLPKMHCVQFDV